MQLWKTPENLWITCVRHARDLVTFITWLERLTSWNYWEVISLCQWILVQYSYQQTKGDTMSANVYSIPDLLIGKTYRSKSLTGEIISAEEHPKAVWYEGCESYLVEVRDSLRGQYTYRTVAIKTS